MGAIEKAQKNTAGAAPRVQRDLLSHSAGGTPVCPRIFRPRSRRCRCRQIDQFHFENRWGVWGQICLVLEISGPQPADFPDRKPPGRSEVCRDSGKLVSPASTFGLGPPKGRRSGATHERRIIVSRCIWETNPRRNLVRAQPLVKPATPKTLPHSATP